MMGIFELMLVFNTTSNNIEVIYRAGQRENAKSVILSQTKGVFNCSRLLSIIFSYASYFDIKVEEPW
jgi:hypothetical protein